MKNKKGFTLIELLAVIIILGVLMIIAIPAVTEYISSSRKSAYVTTASRYIDGLRNKVNAAEIPVYDIDTTYYIPGSCVSMEKGGTSPYGDWEEYYVVVTYDGTSYDYYWTSRDETNTGIYLTYQDLLNVDRIENNVTSISTSIGVGDREKILLLKDSCSINDAEELVATSSIPEKGTSDGSETENPGNISVATDESCFEFDSATGTITDYKCVGSYATNISNYGTENYETRRLNNNTENIQKMSALVEQDVIIPEKINGVTVTKIGDYAFADSNLYTIEIPKTVTYIGEGTLSGNELLYNIVNKTGRSFDWRRITYFGNCDNCVFDVGEYLAVDCTLVSFVRLYITDKRVGYDLSGMFDYKNGISIDLIDDKGYDVFYKNWGDSDWKKFLNNEIQLSNDYNSVSQYNLINNYEIMPVSCRAPSFMIKVEDNGKILFEQYFYFR